MRRHLTILLTLFLFSFASNTMAGPSTDQMADCLVKRTTGQDRIDLARWAVLALSKHPDVSAFVVVDESIDEEIQRSMSELFERLVFSDCSEETKNALKDDGSVSFKNAFTVLGQIAAAELMRRPEVTKSINGFLNYVDTAKLEKHFQLQ